MTRSGGTAWAATRPSGSSALFACAGVDPLGVLFRRAKLIALSNRSSRRCLCAGHSIRWGLVAGGSARDCTGLRRARPTGAVPLWLLNGNGHTEAGRGARARRCVGHEDGREGRAGILGRLMRQPMGLRVWPTPRAGRRRSAPRTSSPGRPLAGAARRPGRHCAPARPARW